MSRPTREDVEELATKIHSSYSNSSEEDLRSLSVLKLFCRANGVPTDSLLQMLTDLKIIVTPKEGTGTHSVDVSYYRSPYYPGKSSDTICELTSDPPIRHAICFEIWSYGKELNILLRNMLGFEHEKVLRKYKKFLIKNGEKICK